jgi:glutamine synthetase
MVKLEYIWLDGYTPEPNLRSKIKVVDDLILKNDGEPLFNKIPNWNFDGSSTQQADGHNSDCILKPVRLYKKNDGTHNLIYVFCEVMNPDGTPHLSNNRANIDDDLELWFGFEQEYFIREDKKGNILGHKFNHEPQGKFYCGVGSNVIGRDLVEEHLDMCLSYGITITGVNAEVALGQWEYQVFSKGAKKAGDDLWMSRYFMEKISEKYGYHIEYHPKPLMGDWNGSGLHTNFSTDNMRNVGGKKYFDSIFKAFESRHEEHIEVYGSNNNLRLTGKHETQSIDKFSWGISDRGASIRVPRDTANEWKGYIEDRRPASNANPYKIIREIMLTLDMAENLLVMHNNMYSTINTGDFESNGLLTPKELLEEYQNDDEYVLTDELMESKANINSTSIGFNVDAFNK